MDALSLCSLLLSLLTAVIFGCFVALFVISKTSRTKYRSRLELCRPEVLYNPLNEDKVVFPSLITEKNEIPYATQPSIYLSVIVPAMNEEKRLPAMLTECLEYLSKRALDDSSFTFEVIVVDDGSTDNTADAAAMYGRRHEGLVRVLKLDENIGKGGAVRAGMLRARGKLVMFADADGATMFSDFLKLEKAMRRLCAGDIDETFPAVVVGSRAHLERESVATRSFFRTVLMIGFHLLVWVFTVRSISDTQCGFKLFTRAAVARIFPVLHVERWAFDVELLYLCEKWKFALDEVSVTWHEVDGSKITPFWSWLEMGRDLFLIWFRYTFGIWNTYDASR